MKRTLLSLIVTALLVFVIALYAQWLPASFVTWLETLVAF